eukprot:2063157-Prymnesium_polylepis.1
MRASRASRLARGQPAAPLVCRSFQKKVARAHDWALVLRALVRETVIDKPDKIMYMFAGPLGTIVVAIRRSFASAPRQNHMTLCSKWAPSGQIPRDPNEIIKADGKLSLATRRTITTTAALPAPRTHK